MRVLYKGNGSDVTLSFDCVDVSLSFDAGAFCEDFPNLSCRVGDDSGEMDIKLRSQDMEELCVYLLRCEYERKEDGE